MRYTLEDMEKHIDPLVLSYIKDHSQQKKFVGSEIKELKKGKNGTSYRSRYIYEYVLDEDKYKKTVHQFFTENILPDLEKAKKTRKKREIGHNITQKEFFETIFRDHFDHRKGEMDNKGRRIYVRSFLVSIDVDARMIDKQTSVYELQKLINKAKKYDYFTPNMFISHQFFTKEMLTLLGVIVLDFDLSTLGISMSKEDLYYHIKDRLKVPPAMIWDTKTHGNYQACILIKPMTGTPSSVHLYEQIVREMSYKLEINDVACTNANHIFSIGKNNARKGRLIRKYNDNEYSINDFRWLLHERDERRKQEQLKAKKVFDFTKEAVRKHPAIKALFEAEDISWRDHACFTLALVMKFLGDSQEEAENYILSQWQPKVMNEGPHPFTHREALKCIRHAYSDKYKCFHSHWVEVCTGLECNLKGYFRYKYESKGIYITDTESRLKEFLRKNGNVFEGKIGDLVEKLGVKRTTLEDIMYKLRDNGELQYETNRGRGAKTTFQLLEERQLEAVIDYDNVYDIDVELTEIVELEEALCAI
ncbi:hypothetical protein [Bacillus cytotoxicus]|uniref:hypothetical protein n=1 Tax=Bacillus cytotoxicus TaxID=580165 RepID=UPI000B9644B8|nr:hypothetical protein [Bacillus cytotoxicus]AWC59316.1 hypothetical protein CG474_000065 [Bacillus cytotoxicus]